MIFKWRESNVNIEVYNSAYIKTLVLLERLDLNGKEYHYRKRDFDLSYIKLIDSNEKSRFFSLLHEIKSFSYFRCLNGFSLISEDSSNQKGVDLLFNSHQIELVTSTVGNIKNLMTLRKVGFSKTNTWFDARQKQNHLMLRFTSVLHDKSRKFILDLEKGVVSKDKPFIIFLSMGELEQEWHHEDYCSKSLSFLLGRGPLSYTFNPKNVQETASLSYSYKPTIFKTEYSEVNLNFFGDENNAHVSGVMISTANISEEYDNNNVVLFLNPFAKNPVETSSFPRIVTWKNYGKIYKPTRDYKVLTEKRKKII